MTLAWDRVFSIKNPMLLPKVRSDALTDSARFMPCALRIASFIPNHRCADPSTVIMAHLPTIGKGNASKVSDLFMVAACFACHELIDRRDKRIAWIEEHYAAALANRYMRGHHETMSRWLGAGLIVVPDGRIVE